MARVNEGKLGVASMDDVSLLFNRVALLATVLGIAVGVRAARKAAAASLAAKIALLSGWAALGAESTLLMVTCMTMPLEVSFAKDEWAKGHAENALFNLAQALPALVVIAWMVFVARALRAKRSTRSEWRSLWSKVGAIGVTGHTAAFIFLYKSDTYVTLKLLALASALHVFASVKDASWRFTWMASVLGALASLAMVVASRAKAPATSI